MRRWLLILSFSLPCWLESIPAAMADDLYLVLVSGVKSTIPVLSTEEMQQLYTVAPMFHNGKAIKPLLNYSDSFTQETFMRKVMHMSTQAYERQVMTKVFRAGGNRPPVYTSLVKLIGALKADPNAVSYMFSDEAGVHPEIKIISTLWKRNH